MDLNELGTFLKQGGYLYCGKDYDTQLAALSLACDVTGLAIGFHIDRPEHREGDHLRYDKIFVSCRRIHMTSANSRVHKVVNYADLSELFPAEPETYSVPDTIAFLADCGLFG